MIASRRAVHVPTNYGHACRESENAKEFGGRLLSAEPVLSAARHGQHLAAREYSLRTDRLHGSLKVAARVRIPLGVLAAQPCGFAGLLNPRPVMPVPSGRPFGPRRPSGG